MKYVEIFLRWFFQGVLELLVLAWVLMLTVGIIHGEWLPMLPTVGYMSACLISIMLISLKAAFQWVDDANA